MNAKPMLPSKSSANAWVSTKSLSLLAVACFAAWGIMVVGSIYLQSDFGRNLVHIPFWLMIGSIGVLLNYLPIAKLKPRLIPLAGIFSVLVTTFWFCVNNFLAMEEFSDLIDVLQVDAILAAATYSLTHISLLLLAYREDRDPGLLLVACAAVAASGIGYIAVFSGIFTTELGFLVLAIVGALFFVKMALTIAVVIVSISTDPTEAKEAKARIG